MEELSRLAASSGAIVTATRALMGDGPNDAEQDDEATLALVQEALATTRRHTRVELWLDTFMDIDRGYFVRNALIDRLSNWRPAGEALARDRARQVRQDISSIEPRSSAP